MNEQRSSNVHADRFDQLISAQGPFASVYFDDTHDTEDAAKKQELTWRSLREQLTDAGAPDAVADIVEQAINDSPPAVGRSGRGLIANAERVLLDEHLLRPPPVTEARFSALPYLVPILEHGVGGPARLVVAVDRQGADITVEDSQGRSTHTETVEGGEYPVHKAAGAETAGYGDPQPVVEEAIGRNIRVVADRVAALTREYPVEPIFVVGEVRARTELLEALPEHVREQSVELEVGSRAAGSDAAGSEDDVAGAVAEELTRRRLEVMDDAAERIRAEEGRGSGLAAEGLEAVGAAIRAASVGTLVIGDLGDRTVLVGDQPTWVATDAGQLSEFGSSHADIRRADEALPFAALATGAAVIRTDERIAPADGCAALLRYA